MTKLITRTDTVGAASMEASQRSPETRDPIELQRAMQENYINELIACINTNKDSIGSNFYVVVITKREPLMNNVFRNYFFARRSCPTPDYDQSVYSYSITDDSIGYLWCIPDKETCLTLKGNALQIHETERQLLKHVLDFSDGTLFTLAKRLNGERDDSVFLEQ